MAVLIHENSKVEYIKPKDEKSFGLDELYEILECNYIDIISVPMQNLKKEEGDRTEAVVDEEGLINEKRYNFLASLALNKVIVGKVLFCTKQELE